MSTFPERVRRMSGPLFYLQVNLCLLLAFTSGWFACSSALFLFGWLPMSRFTSLVGLGPSGMLVVYLASAALGIVWANVLLKARLPVAAK